MIVTQPVCTTLKLSTGTDYVLWERTRLHSTQIIRHQICQGGVKQNKNQAEFIEQTGNLNNAPTYSVSSLNVNMHPKQGK